MFKEVKEKGMPFYKWYRWIEKKFKEKRKEHLAEVKAKLAEVKAQKEFRERVGRTMTITAESSGELS